MGYHHHHEGEDDDNAVVWVYEDPALVLLGGEVWPASFIVCEHVVSFLRVGAPSSLSIVEIGAGTGLCGLVALTTALKNSTGPVHCFLTDESPALSEVNLSHFESTWHAKVFTDPSSSACPPSSTTIAGSSFFAHALELSWGGGPNTVPCALAEACHSSGQVLILGVEVTPMLQTQAGLVETVLALLTISSFPAVPSSSSSSSAPSSSRPPAPYSTTTSSSAAKSSPQSTAVAILTLDACISGKTYPSTCPHPKPCAGHRFIKLVEEREGMAWDVKEVWSASEVQEACRRRRIIAGRSGQKNGETESGSSSSRDFAVTAPEGLVIVHVRLKA